MRVCLQFDHELCMRVITQFNCDAASSSTHAKGKVACAGRTHREEAGADSSFDITATIRAQRLKYLGNILRLSDDESLKIVVTKLTETEDGECPAGFMFMDTPAHADIQQLCDLANGTAGWAKHINDTFPTKKNNDTEPPN